MRLCSAGVVLNPNYIFSRCKQAYFDNLKDMYSGWKDELRKGRNVYLPFSYFRMKTVFAVTFSYLLYEIYI